MTRSTGLVLLPEQALHDTGAHPENSRRIPPVIDRLRNSPEWPDFHIHESRSAGFDDLRRAHSQSQIDLVSDSVRRAPAWLDGDTPVSEASLDVAMKAAGAAMTAVDAVMDPAESAPDSLFALIRPPGHHATA
ncbi:MAG: histone deacetylase, partial [Actinomycetota bacterium]|nr:histone deacetylase [Actinomycetota bacterium]